MAAMDEFKEERESIKNAPLKKKIEYFLDYYKWQTLAIIAVLAFVIYYVFTVVTAKDTLLTGILINTYSTDDVTSELINDFYEKYNIDTNEYEISLNYTLSYSVDDSAAYIPSNQNTTQVILTQTGAGMLDFMTGDLMAMTDIAYDSLFVDLTTVLTEEQIAKYEPYFLYIDQAILDEIEASSEVYADTSKIIYPDCGKPEDMESPIPVFINMSDSEKLADVYAYPVDTLVFGVAGSCKDPETTLDFIDYLMNE